MWIVHSNLHILMCADRVVDLTDKDIIYKSALENMKEENIFAVCLRIIVWMIYDVSIVCIIVRKWICFTKKIKRKYPSLISYIYLYGICKAHILVTHQKKRLIFLRFIIPFLRKTVWGTINSSWSLKSLRASLTKSHHNLVIAFDNLFFSKLEPPVAKTYCRIIRIKIRDYP